MFEEFPKIARLSRDCVITEKIDGTNAQVFICQGQPDYTSQIEAGPPVAVVFDDVLVYAGSRTKFVTPGNDNHGFAAWVKAHAEELAALGPGRHFGEWWGSGIQRGYGLQKGEKRFGLFNTARWAINREDREKYPTDAPACCSVVPVLYSGEFSTEAVSAAIEHLRMLGSVASSGFMKPEGVVVWHEAARQLFKKTLEKDAEGKEQKARRLAHATA